MSDNETPSPKGEKIRKAVCWISETLQSYPEKTRRQVIKEAEIRFDLSPLECEFLNNKIGGER